MHTRQLSPSAKKRICFIGAHCQLCTSSKHFRKQGLSAVDVSSIDSATSLLRPSSAASHERQSHSRFLPTNTETFAVGFLLFMQVCGAPALPQSCIACACTRYITKEKAPCPSVLIPEFRDRRRATPGCPIRAALRAKKEKKTRHSARTPCSTNPLPVGFAACQACEWSRTSPSRLITRSRGLKLDTQTAFIYLSLARCVAIADASAICAWVHPGTLAR